jgi:eukaryotic-like serine/threonine-protein kinase
VALDASDPTGDSPDAPIIGEPSSTESLEIDEDVGQYRIRHLIGSGGMGQVYLARDLLLGRLVALKLVRADRLGSAQVRRLMEEARTTARFNHPHIVTLYNVGTHRSRPYLALEFIEGETLGERMKRGPLSVDEILRLGRAIASALAHAHQENVLHADLKPGNVMIGKDGRVKVVDFGLARDTQSLIDRAGGGTPSHMAPEQWQLEPLMDRTDVWALGLLLFECLEGQHPFSRDDDQLALRRAVLDNARAIPQILRSNVPIEVSRIIRQALARDPYHRPTAIEVCDVLDAALSPFRGLGAAESPFRGLLPFEERHSQVFFGREAEVEELVERLRSEPIIPVVGASGVGKSSFIHAGVVPRLKAQTAWTVLSLRPGRTPLRSIAQALAASNGPDRGADEDDLATRISAMPALLALRLSSLAAATRTRVLLIVDQLEEVFTNVEDPLERQRFLDAIFRAADNASEPVRVIVTVRDDFLGRIGRVNRLFVLLSPDRDALRRTISRPLEQVGYGFEPPTLSETIISEVGESPGELPLLQFALRQLWDGRDESRRVLMQTTYDRFGGVGGALADHADALFATLSEEELKAARQILLRLVSPENTRRIVERPALLSGLGRDGEEALQRLIDGRLLIQSRSRDSGEATIEVAHESLITRWQRFADWLESNREERTFHHELEAAAQLWARRGKRLEETWSGKAISVARHRIAQFALPIDATITEFLELGERRAHGALIRKRWGLAVVASVLFATTIGALALASDYRDREAEALRQKNELLAASENMGDFDVWLEPYDWTLTEQRPVAAAELPNLKVTFFEWSPTDPLLVGAQLANDRVRVEAITSTIATRSGFHVIAPGVAAFLKIEGRGRSGESCPPSWLRARSLPGYSQRREGRRASWTIPIPTCRATMDDMVEIPAGEFVYGGLGDPPSSSLQPEPERIMNLPAFLVDRREVSNREFGLFAKTVKVSNEDLPNYPAEATLPGAAHADHPVTGISGRTAEAYCRFLGKRLPTFAEWSKLVRGGLTLPDGKPNPRPRRVHPWLGATVPKDVNFGRATAPKTFTQAVDAGHEPHSIYGIFDLVGNVKEWGNGWEAARDYPLWPVFGGDYDSPADEPTATSANSNMREPRYFDFSTGVRCVLDPVRRP